MTKDDTCNGYSNYSTWYIKAQFDSVKKDYDAVNGMVPENRDVSALADAMEDYVHQNAWRMQFPSPANHFHLSQVIWWEIAEAWIGDLDS